MGVGIKSWDEDRYGVEPEVVSEVVFPVRVEFFNGVAWDLWWECEGWDQVEVNRNMLDERMVGCRLVDAAGRML